MDCMKFKQALKYITLPLADKIIDHTYNDTSIASIHCIMAYMD